MKNRWAAFVVLLALTLHVTGCATARPRRPETTAPQVNPQVTELENQLQAKDQQIQDLQYQLEQSRRLSVTSYSSPASGSSSKIRLSGVSVEDVQKALERAGFDPGPADGKYGIKTKAAVKAFQRARGLKADGIVGEKTWKLLQA